MILLKKVILFFLRGKNIPSIPILLCYVFIIFFACSACVGTKFLEKDQWLLRKQSIENVPKDIKLEEMNNFLLQYPNSRLPLVGASPSIWLYQWGIKRIDTTQVNKKIQKINAQYDANITQTTSEKEKKKYILKKEKKIAKQLEKLEKGNWLMRLGEPLATYDAVSSQTTIRNIQRYLNSEGYFGNQVSLIKKNKNKKLMLKYSISYDTPYKIQQFKIIADDSLLLDKITNHQPYFFPKEPIKYREKTLINIRNEVEQFLKNNGYYGFNKDKTLHYQVDSIHTKKKKRMNVTFRIDNAKTNYKTFHFDTVRMLIKHPFLKEEPTTSKYDDIDFSITKNKYSRKQLSFNVAFRPKQLFSQQAISKTQKNLFNLDIFRSVNFKFDTVGYKVNCYIDTVPLKKYQTNTETGLDYNEQGFPAPFVKFNFKIRNFVKSLDILNFNAKIEFRYLPLATDINTSFLAINTQGGIVWTFPQFIFPFGNKMRSRFDFENLRTIFTLGGSFSLRPDYERTIINTSLGYRWKKGINNLLFKLNDLSWINTPYVSTAFINRLINLGNNGNNILRAFITSLASSISLENIILFNDYGYKQKRSAYLRLFIENGGTFLPLYRDLLDIEKNNLVTFNFFKAEIDYRQIIPLSRGLNIAFRLKGGILIPYGENRIAPYTKYFFSGDNNGMRAWLPRRLGPGSSANFNDKGEYDESFEQPGEIQLEGSLEFRRDLIGFLKGAFFIDVGNIWNITDTIDQPKEAFVFQNILSDIAVGIGFGLRLDFSFLILRLDMATKAHDPARPEGARFFLHPKFYSGAFKNQSYVNYNIGIGYPF